MTKGRFPLSVIEDFNINYKDWTWDNLIGQISGKKKHFFVTYFPVLISVHLWKKFELIFHNSGVQFPYWQILHKTEKRNDIGLKWVMLNSGNVHK